MEEILAERRVGLQHMYLFRGRGDVRAVNRAVSVHSEVSCARPLRVRPVGVKFATRTRQQTDGQQRKDKTPTARRAHAPVNCNTYEPIDRRTHANRQTDNTRSQRDISGI